jgi:hypothetical protein
MRRLFSGVPVIYGFSSKAPYGRYAGPLLESHFRSAGGEAVGTGVANEQLRRLFAPASMVVTAGQGAAEPNADYRGEVCRYYDARVAAGAKLASIHATLRSSMAEARIALDRIEKFLRELAPAERADPAFNAAMAAIAGDAALAQRYLLMARDTSDPAVRLRLIALGRELGWLSGEGVRAEQLRLVSELMASKASGFHEVELVCSLNRDGGLDGSSERLPQQIPARTTQHAALACLGHAQSRGRVLEALASRDESEVQVAAAYLRHRPIAASEELRAVAYRVVRMPESSAQVRALEAIARQRVADRETLDELTRLFSRTRSPAVRRAIEEVFLRSEFRDLAPRAGG